MPLWEVVLINTVVFLCLMVMGGAFLYMVILDLGLRREFGWYISFADGLASRFRSLRCPNKGFDHQQNEESQTNNNEAQADSKPNPRHLVGQRLERLYTTKQTTSEAKGKHSHPYILVCHAIPRLFARILARLKRGGQRNGNVTPHTLGSLVGGIEALGSIWFFWRFFPQWDLSLRLFAGAGGAAVLGLITVGVIALIQRGNTRNSGE